jgi:ribosome-associated translation inhibitor RaiA
MADIRYIDFTPTEEDRKYASAVVTALLEGAPSDGTIVAEIRRLANDVITQLNLNSSQIRCKSEASARTVYASVDKAAGVIEEQIFDWKASLIDLD